MKLSKVKVPDTLLILSTLIVVAAIFSWIIPGGQYQREMVDGHERVIPESFHYVDKNPQSFDDILIAPIRGFVDASLIIGFVLIVGGMFGVLQRTTAIDAGIHSIVRLQRRHKQVRFFLIPVFMSIFSLGGSVFGMSEETIPFILIFVPLALALGYDSIVGVAIPFVGAGAGFAGAFLNPFTVGIAQGIAGLPLFSGLQYRFISWTVTTVVAIAFVMAYARKITKHPEKSICFQLDQKKREDLKQNNSSIKALDRRHIMVLLVFLLSMIILVIGVLKFHWYIEEIAALFLASGVAIGITGRLKASETSEAFMDGARSLVATAIIIGLARGILIIAQQGLIIDTMLNSMSSAIGAFHPIVSSQLMFITQTFINFFVPSGSGQAALTMPVMAPLADLVGISRQTAVLAYQFGDGFSNMIIPTSPVTMGVLALAGIPWEKWARWILPLELILLLVGLILLIPPYFIQW